MQDLVGRRRGFFLSALSIYLSIWMLLVRSIMEALMLVLSFVCALSYFSIIARCLVLAIANKDKEARSGSLAKVGISGILLKR